MQLTCVDNLYRYTIYYWYGEDMSSRLRPPQAQRASALAAELRNYYWQAQAPATRTRELGPSSDAVPGICDSSFRERGLCHAFNVLCSGGGHASAIDGRGHWLTRGLGLPK